MLTCLESRDKMIPYNKVNKTFSKNVEGCRDGVPKTRCRDGSVQARHVIQRLHN